MVVVACECPLVKSGERRRYGRDADVPQNVAALHPLTSHLNLPEKFPTRLHGPFSTARNPVSSIGPKLQLKRYTSRQISRQHFLHDLLLLFFSNF
jgi:hypothetical protein